MATNDPINPAHYTNHPSGVECIEISKYLSGCLAQAFQYVWRCGQKDDHVQELKKALWFVNAEKNLKHCQYLDPIVINENLQKVCQFEPDINKKCALISIALANIDSKERDMTLNNAVKLINAMIYQLTQEQP
jgi:hypothetical protein